MGLYRRGKFYWYSISFEGKRIQRSLKTDNRRFAEKLFAKVLTDIIEGTYFEKTEARRHSFEELRERYMKEHSMINKTPKSSTRDVTSFKHLSKCFSGMTLAEMTPARISEYKSLRRSEGARPATLSRELEVLRHALNLAVREWEWLHRNPFERVRIEKPNNKVERWITPEEEQNLLTASPPWLREIIIVALHTGMRQNELLSLTWPQINLMRRALTLTETKNKEKRTIPLNQTVLEILKNRSKVRHITGHVFTSQAGSKIDARNLLRAFYAARERAGLTDVRWHDLRHTFASRLVQAGIDLYVVKELLGHKTIAMTLRYAHHYPESLRHGVDILDTCYNSATFGRKENFISSTSSQKPLKERENLVAGGGFEPPTFGL
jgi:site-specific recombinase XerD